MSESIAVLRRQQHREHLYAASVRAISGEPQLRWRDHRLVRDGTPIAGTAPHLHPAAGDDDSSWRGAADGLALRLLHSDAALCAATAPEGEVAAFVFELLEQYRVEALGVSSMVGTVRNLRHRHHTWCTAFGVSGLPETPEGLVLYAVAIVCRAKVSGEPVDVEVEDVIESTRIRLAPRIGASSAALRRSRGDQATYAVHARNIAEIVTHMVEAAAPEHTSRGSSLRTRGGFSLLGASPQDPSTTGEGAESAGRADVRALLDHPQVYRVHTRAYDRTVPVTELIRPARLTAYRQRLDELTVPARPAIGRCARQLSAVLARPESDGLQGAQEEGVIDGRSLTRLITSEQERRIFQRPRIGARAGTRVTLLIDCSGSMRRHQELTAPLVDLLVRALDLAQVSNQVLGFSTGAWHGGRALRDWKRSGSGAVPGRVAERLHLVFKDFDTSWRRARPALAGLLNDELCREGLDGEALAWAGDRTAATAGQQHLMIVLCDGSPMESATTATNGDRLLDAHLRAVIDDQEAKRIRVVGLGFGSDVGRFYPVNHTLDVERRIDRRTLDGVVQLIEAGQSDRRQKEAPA